VVPLKIEGRKWRESDYSEQNRASPKWSLTYVEPNPSGAYLSEANPREVYLVGVFHYRAYLSGTNPSGALPKWSLTQVEPNQSGAYLSEANPREVYLVKAFQFGAYLSGSNPKGA
jgi:uncharacterized protein YjbI with pentapeptide repeats